MREAWNEVARYFREDRQHDSRGFTMATQAPHKVLCCAAEELMELALSTDAWETVQQDELADLLICLFHYALLQGWTATDLQSAVLRQLRQHFAAPAGLAGAHGPPVRPVSVESHGAGPVSVESHGSESVSVEGHGSESVSVEGHGGLMAGSASFDPDLAV